MALVWQVECKLCALRFSVLPRTAAAGKATDALPGDKELGRFECPHCHEIDVYASADLIPGEGRIVTQRADD